jgi:hypothetical protein
MNGVRLCLVVFEFIMLGWLVSAAITAPVLLHVLLVGGVEAHAPSSLSHTHPLLTHHA